MKLNTFSINAFTPTFSCLKNYPFYSHWKMLNLESLYTLHNWSLQRFSLVYNLASFSLARMLCVLILYNSDGDYSINSIPNDRFVRSFSWHFYFTLKVCARNLRRGNRLQLKVEKLFSAIFLFTLRVVVRNLLRGSRWRNFIS